MARPLLAPKSKAKSVARLFMVSFVPMGKARGAGDGIVAPGGAKRNPGSTKRKTIRAPLGGAKEIPLYPPVRFRSTAHREKSASGMQTLPPALRARLLFVSLNPGFRFAPPGATIPPPALRALEFGHFVETAAWGHRARRRRAELVAPGWRAFCA